MIYCTDVEKNDRIHTSCDILDRKHDMTNPTKFLTPTFAENIKCKVPTEYVKHEEYDQILHRCEQFDQIRQSHHIFSRIHRMWKSDRISHTYILPKCVTCKKFDRICHLWGIRSNTLQLWNYGKIDLIRHTFVINLTENITYEKYVPVSHTYNSPKCVTCNTSDQIYLARDKFDRKLPCCKNNSTELFIVVTYLTKYMTCEKSDRISHTYISPKISIHQKCVYWCASNRNSNMWQTRLG